ncbi:MAG: tRNA (adenosine(37)-N6)-threonylcarbamoyltransferase complex dimerization subunit type 1 TsaB [Streptococcaceae bacterium]|jgi:tRNA threonylcarbamoyl adenosine modification protein YeaZ|nr:tRNA (adenosine(37)-N6)-threonylcarbamoyltransferase complex dimerization subunit type 1 TsaB [Streptococcaceae bacterium]
MKILALDTSNKTLSVALLENDSVVASFILNTKKNHSVTLMPTIDHLFQAASWVPKQLEKIVVSAGPGSYTGVRIALATAKTLSYTLNKPLVAISSLALMAQNAFFFKGLIVPLFDALRDNVYAGNYRFIEGKLTSTIKDKYISFAELLASFDKKKRILFIGEDVKKFQSKIKTLLPQAVICQNAVLNIPHAANLALMSQDIAPVKDVHAFVPWYLKRVEAEEKWLKRFGNKHSSSNLKIHKRAQLLSTTIGVKRVNDLF